MSRKRGAGKEQSVEDLHRSLDAEQSNLKRIQHQAKEILKKYSAAHYKIRTEQAKNSITEADDLTQFNHHVQQYSNTKSQIYRLTNELHAIEETTAGSSKIQKTTSKPNKNLNFAIEDDKDLDDDKNKNGSESEEGESESEDNQFHMNMGDSSRESGECSTGCDPNTPGPSFLNKTLSMQNIWDKKMNLNCILGQTQDQIVK